MWEYISKEDCYILKGVSTTYKLTLVGLKGWELTSLGSPHPPLSLGSVTVSEAQRYATSLINGGMVKI